MVLPLIPLAIAGVAGGTGALAGWGLSDILGGSKKGAVSEANIYHQPYETYAPQNMYAPQVAYTYQGASYFVNSPGASSKKEATVSQTGTPSQTGTWELPQTTNSPSGLQFDTTTLLILGIIAATAVIGYGMVSGGKK